MGCMQTLEVLELIKDVAERVINPRFQALANQEIDQKRPGDYVTIADREAEELITAELRARIPDVLVVGEEAAHADPGIIAGLATAAHAFTVDPVDGTGNFIKGSTRHAVMLSEVRFGEVTRAWIWQPQLERAYLAERGGGVQILGAPDPVRAGPPLDPPIGATSRRAWLGFDAGGQLAPVRPANQCAGFDYPQLLHGGFDFLAYLRPKPWDHLPGLLMVSELGGATIDIHGRPYGPATPTTTTIISAITSQLARTVAQHWLAGLCEPTAVPNG